MPYYWLLLPQTHIYCAQLPTRQGVLAIELLIFWTKSLLWSTVLCIIGCLAGSLASTHWMRVAAPNCNNQKCLRIFDTCPGGQNCPWLRTTLRISIVNWFAFIVWNLSDFCRQFTLQYSLTVRLYPYLNWTVWVFSYLMLYLKNTLFLNCSTFSSCSWVNHSLP